MCWTIFLGLCNFNFFLDQILEAIALFCMKPCTSVHQSSFSYVCSGTAFLLCSEGLCFVEGPFIALSEFQSKGREGDEEGRDEEWQQTIEKEEKFFMCILHTLRNETNCDRIYI